jgi:hypothetical protein
MIRSVLVGLCAAWIAVGLWGVTHDWTTWPLLVFPALLLAAIIFERVHYRGNATDAAAGDWRPTGERFLDEASGKPVVVWFNPTTGERRYVEE